MLTKSCYIWYNISVNGGAYQYYFYETNLLGDITGVYNSDGDVIVRYTYDAWGNFFFYLYDSTAVDSTLNQAILFRYRGYIYDLESGLYYLQSRYYDANVGRFINPDGTSLLSVSPYGISDKNLYTYCDNNPIMRTDKGGTAWETVFDIISLGLSIGDVMENYDDPMAWVGLVGDAIDLIPFVTGVGETARVVNTGRKIADDNKVKGIIEGVKEMLSSGSNTIVKEETEGTT